MKLLTKFYLANTVIFILLTAVVLMVSIQWVERNTIHDASQRIELGMNNAWNIYSEKAKSSHQLLEIIAQVESVRKFMENPSNPQLRALVSERLQKIRIEHKMDILNLILPDGGVLLRTRVPYSVGDDLSDDPLVRKVVESQKSMEGTIIIEKSRLQREGGSLLERCMDTTGQPRGLFTGSAVPVFSSEKLVGVIQMGAILNDNHEIVDKIKNIVFEDKIYNGRSIGTATVFMDNIRISTNVIGQNHGRATGTTAVAPIAEHVLRTGKPWQGRAWVVDASYIGHYDPIVDPDGRIIGMLYIGELEQKYIDIKYKILLTISIVLLIAMIITNMIFYFLARTILVPVKKLIEATRRISEGETSIRVEGNFSGELGDLAKAFNLMAGDMELHNREINLKHKELEELNNELELINRNYISMLGFVSHELKNPLASAVMSLYTVKDGYLGELNEKQKKGLDAVGESLDYFKELIMSYLDLSRLEKGEYLLNRRSVNLRESVIAPVVAGLETEIKNKNMSIDVAVREDITVNADPDLLRIVYDNLIANAVKYGREGTLIRLSSEARNGKRMFSVYNEGAGIPEEKMYMLFKKFSRIYSSEHAGKKGSGLGLYTCAEIIKKHGGKIWAESEPDKWVRFSFSFDPDESL